MRWTPAIVAVPNNNNNSSTGKDDSELEQILRGCVDLA